MYKVNESNKYQILNLLHNIYQLIFNTPNIQILLLLNFGSKFKNEGCYSKIWTELYNERELKLYYPFL
jgi:hypothetical protein